jgi:hypothetical protein
MSWRLIINLGQDVPGSAKLMKIGNILRSGEFNEKILKKIISRYLCLPFNWWSKILRWFLQHLFKSPYLPSIICGRPFCSYLFDILTLGCLHNWSQYSDYTLTEMFLIITSGKMFLYFG